MPVPVKWLLYRYAHAFHGINSPDRPKLSGSNCNRLTIHQLQAARKAALSARAPTVNRIRIAMNTHPMTDSKPWYQQFWFWFVFSIPAASVILGVTLVTIAINNRVELVKDDWSREGRAINQRFEKQRAALALGVAALVDYDPDRLTFSVQFSTTEAYQAPLLYLELIHPTLGKRDHRLLLSPTPRGDYHATTNTSLHGLYYVRLYDEAHQWQVDGTVQFDNVVKQHRLSAQL
jgi:hypothetical protein